MVSGPANSSSSGSESDRKEPRYKRGEKRVKPPLNEAALRDLALSYAARFASTGARLEAYLARKLRERGVAEDADGRSAAIDIPALVARLVELGYVDDAAYARSRARDLGARGTARGGSSMCCGRRGSMKVSAPRPRRANGRAPRRRAAGAETAARAVWRRARGQRRSLGAAQGPTKKPLQQCCAQATITNTSASSSPPPTRPHRGMAGRGRR